MTYQWDSAPPPPSGNYVRWNVMNVPLHGTIVAIQNVPNRFKKKDTDPDLVIEMVLDGDRVLALRQSDLHHKVFDLAPSVGDGITVTWTGVETNGSLTKKIFNVTVDRAAHSS